MLHYYGVMPIHGQTVTRNLKTIVFEGKYKINNTVIDYWLLQWLYQSDQSGCSIGVYNRHLLVEVSV